MQYNNNLAKIRKQKGYSQREIAEVLKTTQQQINKYENGQQEMNVSRFIELADFYNITLDELAGRKMEHGTNQNE